MNSQFKKGILELCVLSLLSKQDFYGYELVNAISEHVETAEGTIYPILRRLSSDGLTETYLRESAEGPPRKYYRLSAKGKIEYISLLAEWQKFSTNIQKIINYKTKNIKPVKESYEQA